MFQGTIWWITGASSGIGAALAAALSDAGASLILSGRNEAALQDVAARSKTPTLILPFEAADFTRLPAIVGQAWAWASEQGASISGLVNNAGISQRSLAVDTAFAVYQRLIEVDLLAPIALTQALLPRMTFAIASPLWPSPAASTCRWWASCSDTPTSPRLRSTPTLQTIR